MPGESTNWDNSDDELLNLAYQDESSTGRPCSAFMESLPNSHFKATERIICEPSKAHCYTSAFVFGVLASLHLYVREWLEASESNRNVASQSFPLNKVAWKIARNGSGLRSWRPEKADSPSQLSQMFKFLLGQGFSLNEKYFAHTPFETIFCRAFEGFGGAGGSPTSPEMIDVTRTIVKHGDQDPNAKLRYGDDEYRFFGTSGYQLEQGQPRFWSALHVSYGDMTKMLLENGADPNIQDSKGNTALDICVGTENNVFEIGDHRRPEEAFSMTMMLLAHGARLTQRGRKILPTFLKIMNEHAGFSFPDTLQNHETLPCDISAEDIFINKRFLTSTPTNSSRNVSEENVAQGAIFEAEQESIVQVSVGQSKAAKSGRMDRVKGRVRKLFARD